MMLLSAKYTRKHGMKSEKWDNKDKTQQYRSILKLYERDKKLQAINAAKLKKKLSKNIRELKDDVKEYRRIIEDVCYGDKRLIRLLIQGEKDFEILLQDAKPEEVWRVVFQDYNNKRKQLDKLIYQKKNIKHQLCVARSEYEELIGELDDSVKPTPEEEKQQIHQQALISYIQVALAKRYAGIAVRETYQNILVILKKDSMYFDGVLNALRSEQRDQSKMIYRTTLIGQLAAETLDDIRQNYKKMADEVWINMREREHSLDVMKRKCADIWEYAKSLVRVESDLTLVKKKSDGELDEDKKLKLELQRLEDIFNQMKESMLIRSYEELFLRLEDQMKQKIKLSKIYDDCMKERNRMLNKKNHAELIHKNLEHSMLTTTTSYKSNKREMLEKIEEEKKREENKKMMIEVQGKLLTNVRASLMHLASILMCIPGSNSKKSDVDANAREDNKDKKMCSDYTDEDAVELLNQVHSKAITLFQQSNYPLTEEKMEKVRQTYLNYVAEYQSKLKFGKGVQEVQGIVFEHEAVDSTVLTRADIKLKSKRLVEAHAVKNE